MSEKKGAYCISEKYRPCLRRLSWAAIFYLFCMSVVEKVVIMGLLLYIDGLVIMCDGDIFDSLFTENASI